MRKLLCVFMACAVCAFFLTNAQAAVSGGDRITIRLAHNNTPTDMDPFHAIAVKMKDKLKARLGDRVELQEFHSAQLGSEERSFQDVQNGVLQMAIVAGNNAAIFSPSMGAMDLPYIFTSVEDFNKCVDENWDLINKRLEEEAGVLALVWHDQGFRFLTNSRHPIRKIDDLRDVKIRTPNNPVMIGTYKAWGTNPVPMAMEETFNALQQKVVDGQDNPLVSIATNRFYEVQDHVTDVYYKLWTGPLVVNAEWLRSQPEDVQKAIIEAGRETTLEMRDLIKKQENEARQFLKDKGMKFAGRPEDEDVWMKKAVAIWPDFYPQIRNLDVARAFMKSLGRELPEAKK